MSERAKKTLDLSVLSVLSAKLVSTLAINASVPGLNPNIDGYFSTSLKALGNLSGYCSAIKMPAVEFSLSFVYSY